MYRILYCHDQTHILLMHWQRCTNDFCNLDCMFIFEPPSTIPHSIWEFVYTAHAPPRKYTQIVGNVSNSSIPNKGILKNRKITCNVHGNTINKANIEQTTSQTFPTMSKKAFYFFSNAFIFFLLLILNLLTQLAPYGTIFRTNFWPYFFRT